LHLAGNKLSSSSSILAVGEVIGSDGSSTGADAIASVADDLDLVSRDALDGLLLDYNIVSLLILVLIDILNLQGSPKLRTAATLAVVSAGRALAALCTSIAPWEYPDMTILVLGHFLAASVTRLALFSISIVSFLVWRI
jgi:hypothetical protein